MKVRQNLYLDRELTEALSRLARGRNGNKSRIVNDALGAFLKRRAENELDGMFKVRLDRMSRDISLVRRDLEILIESHALLVRYQLTVTAPLPEADSAALAVGNERFERFIAQVGRQIASGKRTLSSAGAAQ
jgi:hypothetical protein